MKTLEFKLDLTQEQQALINQWLADLKWVWNRGLRLLEEDQQRRWRDKHGHLLPDSLKLQWRNGQPTGSGVRKTRDGYKYCAIRQDRDVEDVRKFFSSDSYHNKKNTPQWLHDVPAKFRVGVSAQLKQAWKSYQDPKHPAKRPRYKGKRDCLRSLVNRNAGGKNKELNPEQIGDSWNAYVRFPKLGKLKVKGFYRRFFPNDGWGSARILVEPSGYYLQVAVEQPDEVVKESDKAVGIDPGVANTLTLDNGRHVKPNAKLDRHQKRLLRLQRRASRQKRGSNSQQRTHQAIARQHEKIRRSRNAFNHKLSTKLTREYGAIAFEDTQLQNMTRRSKPKPREDGKGWEQNGAKRKTGLNRSLANIAIGDLKQKTKDKATALGREFITPDAKYSSQECHVCGERGERLSQSVFICLNPDCKEFRCEQHADTNAARNLLLRALPDLEREYRPWGWELKREESVSPTGGTTSNGETPSKLGMPPEAVTVLC